MLVALSVTLDIDAPLHHNGTDDQRADLIYGSVRADVRRALTQHFENMPGVHNIDISTANLRP